MNRTISSNAMSPPHSNWSFPYHAILPCRNTTEMTMFLVASYSIETTLGVLGNICFIGILVRHKEKAIVSTILITNLVISDLVVCIFCLPFTIVTILFNYWLFGEAMCRMTSFIQCTSVTVSILSLMLIALERHQLIINPTGWRPSPTQAYLGIASIWTFASLLSLPFVMNCTLTSDFFKQFYFMDSYAGQVVCMCSWPSEEHRLAYTTALLLLQYWIPLVFIAVCYLRIYLRLRKRESMFEKREDNCRLTQLKRVNVLLAFMVAAFAVCWLPLHVFNSIDDWNYKIIPSCLHDLIFSLCHLAAMASTCVNPIIYGFLNKNFKKEVKGLVLNCHRRSSGQAYESMPLSTMQTEAFKGSQRSSCQQAPI